MKKTLMFKSGSLLFALALLGVNTPQLLAQVEEPTEIETTTTDGIPLDDITDRNVIAEKKILPYAAIREADILWEKRIWRVIDVREKMNLAFSAPESPLFIIMRDAILKGDMAAYSTENDKFTIRMAPQEVRSLLVEIDTVITVNMTTGEEEVKIVENETDWTNVKRFRIKETWYFDKNLGTLRNRILGIAPMIDVTNDNGDFLYERPLFWVHYPTARATLAQHKALTSTNDSANTTWEDVFETRHFASYITKESNVHDRRLQDYLAGVDLLMEGKKINDEIFNQEHDLWSW